MGAHLTRCAIGVVMALSVVMANAVAAQGAGQRASSGATRDTLRTRCDSILSAFHLDSAQLAAIGETLQGHGGMVVRWPNGSDEAVRVWIQPRPISVGSLTDPTESTRAVSRALSAWNSTTGLRFTTTPDSARADVHIVWVQSLSRRADMPASRPAARTTIRGVRTTGIITGALVQIRETRSTGVPFGPDEVYAIALHETGHVIGLKHRSDEESFMTSGMRAGTLTAADIDLARAWYALPLGTVCQSR